MLLFWLSYIKKKHSQYRYLLVISSGRKDDDDPALKTKKEKKKKHLPILFNIRLILSFPLLYIFSKDGQ